MSLALVVGWRRLWRRRYLSFGGWRPLSVFRRPFLAGFAFAWRQGMAPWNLACIPLPLVVCQEGGLAEHDIGHKGIDSRLPDAELPDQRPEPE